MIRVFALLYGIIFLLVGGASVLPQAVPEVILPYLAHKKMATLAFLFFGTGIWGFIAAWVSQGACRFFFQITGIIYATLAILGFIYGQRAIFNFIPSNLPHTWFYAIVGLTSLIYGFGSKGDQ